MRGLSAAVVALLAAGSGSHATFSVDGAASTSTTVIATIQPRTGAPGYSWLRIYFYPSSLGAGDRAKGVAGRVGAITARWNAVVQLTVDRDATVWQIDLSLPGHTCTIAESDRHAREALQEWTFDGTRLRLTGRGSHVCDLRSLGLPNQTFRWDLDVDIPVVLNAP
jgi:hypothetical protein